MVDVLDRGLAVTQPSGAQSVGKRQVPAISGLAVEQKGQPFGVRQIAGLLLRFELDEGLEHTIKLERSELIESGMGPGTLALVSKHERRPFTTITE
jgi:hypothetical protein